MQELGDLTIYQNETEKWRVKLVTTLLFWMSLIIMASTTFVVFSSGGKFTLKEVSPYLTGVSFLIIREYIKRTGKHRGVTLLCFFIGLASIMARVYLTGGVSSLNIVWITMIPLMSFLLLPINWAISVVALCITSVTMIYLSPDFFGLLKDTQIRELSDTAKFLQPLFSLILIGSFSWIFSKKRKQLEEELQKKSLEVIHNAKLAELSEVTAGIAHEINNPLTMMLLHTDIIKEKLEGEVQSNELTEYLDGVKGTIHKISHIIKSMKKLTRVIDDSKEQFISLAEMIDDINSFYATKIRAKDIQFDVITPPEADSFIIPLQFEQVIINLLNNATHEVSKYKHAWIRVESKVIDDRISLSVTDSGKGINEEIASKLFNPFFTTKSIEEGTGLGLSISKKVAQRFNGNLIYDSTSDNTKFICLIPYRISSIKRYEKAS